MIVVSGLVLGVSGHVVDQKDGVTFGLRGLLNLRPIVEVEVPIGARFPFDDPSERDSTSTLHESSAPARTGSDVQAGDMGPANVRGE